MKKEPKNSMQSQRYFGLSYLLGAFLAIILIVTGCSKLDETEKGLNLNADITTRSETDEPNLEMKVRPDPVKSAQVTAATEQFRQDLKKWREGDFSVGQNSFTSDQLVTNLENLFNYVYSKPSKTFSHYEFYRDFLTISSADDGFSKQAIVPVYEGVYAKVKGWYDAVEGSNKSIVMVDIGALLKGNSADVELHFACIIGVSEISPTTINDDWMWGMGWGKCDWSNSGTAANDILKNEINSAIGHANGVPNGLSGFTNIVAIGINHNGGTYGVSHSYPMLEEYDIFDFPNTNQTSNPDPDDGILDFLIHFDGPGDNICLESSELNFYYSSYIGVMSSLTPSGKTFVSTYIHSDALSGSGLTNKQHPTLFFYGEPVEWECNCDG